MPGVFKKLNAQDIKITPFEAHKQYNTTDLASIGAQTASLAWSGKNKSTFTDGSRKYYQIEKKHKLFDSMSMKADEPTKPQ